MEAARKRLADATAGLLVLAEMERELTELNKQKVDIDAKVEAATTQLTATTAAIEEEKKLHTTMETTKAAKKEAFAA